MLAAMRQVYAAADLRVVLGTIENLTLPAQLVADVGDCADGFGDNITGDQWILYRERGFAGENDIVLYFVKSTDPTSNGCAKHPDGRAGAIVASVASRWTMAHEVGHVLGLGHVDELTRLMTGGGTHYIVDEPPNLSRNEISDMHGSDYTFDA
jgi:hypothetical protein